MDNNSTDNKPQDNGGGTSIDVISKPSIADSGSNPQMSPSDAQGSMATSDSSSSMSDGASIPDAQTPGKVTPVTASSMGNKGSKTLTILLSILILIIFVGGVYGVYEWQHKQLVSQQSQVTTLQTEVSSLNAKLAKINSSPTVSVSTTSNSTTTNTTTFKVAELGVSFSVPYILSDLTYSANADKSSVNLSTQTLTDLDPACASSATGTSALGNITKTTGQYKTSTSTTLIKQYPTYYIAYTEPTSACSKIPAVASLTTTLTNDLKQTFSSVASL
jgi:hypothetical protein